MAALQILGAASQEPVAQIPPGARFGQLHRGSFLGNVFIQTVSLHNRFSISTRSSVAGSKLDRLKRQRFTAEGRTERIAKSLDALHQPQPIQLSREQWKALVDDADAEDQF